MTRGKGLMRVRVNGYEIGVIRTDTKQGQRGQLVISIFDEDGRLLLNARVNIEITMESDIEIKAPIRVSDDEGPFFEVL